MSTQSRPSTEDALQELLAAAIRLSHRAKAAAEKAHRQGEATAGRRGVLLSLQRGGPATVPQLARMRPVSRQHIQVLVNSLRRDGLVELADNPAHRRSHLVSLTARGQALLTKMRAREDALFRRLRLPVDGHQLQAAAAVLQQVTAALASPQFERLAGAPEPGPARAHARLRRRPKSQRDDSRRRSR